MRPEFRQYRLQLDMMRSPQIIERRAISTLAKRSLRLEVLGSYAQTEPVG